MRDIDNVLNMIQERTFTKSKIVFWEQTLPGIVKALYKASVIAKKYRLWVKKMEREEPQEWAEPGIELIVSQQSVIGAALGTIRKKQGRFTEKYTFTLSDGNNPYAYKYGKGYDEYVIETWDETLNA
jgi:hypothetical protein